MKHAVSLIANNSALSPVQLSTGGRYLFWVNGTFNTAVISLRVTYPGAPSYIERTSDNITSADGKIVELPGGCVVSAAITGGTPSGLNGGLALIG